MLFAIHRTKAGSAWGRSALLVVAALVAACASQPPERYVAKTIAPADRPNILVLPFAVGPGAAGSKQYAALNKFEAKFFAAGVVSDVNGSGAANAYYLPLVPPAGVDYVVRGTIDESDLQRVAVSVELTDIGGSKLASYHYDVDPHEMKGGRRLSNELPLLMRNDIVKWMERHGRQDMQQVADRQTIALSGAGRQPPSARSRAIYAETGGQLRSVLLAPTAADVDRFFSQKQASYERFRGSLADLDRQKAAAEQARNTKAFASVLMLAAAFGAAATGQIDSNGAQQAVAYGVKSGFDAADASDKARQISSDIDSELASFDQRTQGATTLRIMDSTFTGTLGEVLQLVKGKLTTRLQAAS